MLIFSLLATIRRVGLLFWEHYFLLKKKCKNTFTNEIYFIILQYV